MPLVKYLGNATPQDNTERIDLFNREDGSRRYILLGGDAVAVTGHELRQMASNYQIEVVDDSVEPDMESEPKEDDEDSKVADVTAPTDTPDTSGADPQTPPSGAMPKASATTSPQVSTSSGSAAAKASPAPTPGTPDSAGASS